MFQTAQMMVSGQLNLGQAAQGAGYSEEMMNFFGTQVALMKARKPSSKPWPG